VQRTWDFFILMSTMRHIENLPWGLRLIVKIILRHFSLISLIWSAIEKDSRETRTSQNSSLWIIPFHLCNAICTHVSQNEIWQFLKYLFLDYQTDNRLSSGLTGLTEIDTTLYLFSSFSMFESRPELISIFSNFRGRDVQELQKNGLIRQHALKVSSFNHQHSVLLYDNSTFPGLCIVAI